MNRVTTMIARREKEIAEKLKKGQITKEQVDKAHKALDMAIDEYVMLQELKSLAVASNVLTADEGMTIYNYLGCVPTTYNKQSVAVKGVINQIYQELLGKRIAGKL